MENHSQSVENSCRICGGNLKAKGKRKTKCRLFQQQISKLWQQNVALDSPNVHPLHMCNKCRSFCVNARYLSGELKCNQPCIVWAPHSGDDCLVCQTYPKSSGPGRRKKKQKKVKIDVPSTSLDGEVSTTESGSDSGSEQNLHVPVYAIFMEDVRESVSKIPLDARAMILKELLCLDQEETIVVDTVMQTCMALPVSQKINLLKNLCTGINGEDVLSGFLLSLPIETLQLLTYLIFRGQQREVLNDANLFCQTYKNIDIIKNIHQETWLQRRNQIVVAAVNGIADESVSKFQKCIAVEHLYSLAGNGQFVLPFSFLVNLMLFTITNSKLALSIVSKVLPGGSYSAVTGWRDSLASVPPPFPSGNCIAAFDNDQIVQRKWKVKVGQKARVSILTSICQTVIDEDGSLQQREDLAPRSWPRKLCQANQDSNLASKLKEGLSISPAEENVLKYENKLVIHECLKGVVAEQLKSTSGFTDDIDKKVSEIEKKKTTRTCPNCSTEMPRQKRVCINQGCRVNLKAAENKLSGEDILGTALLEPVRQGNHSFKEHEVVLTVGDASNEVASIVSEMSAVCEDVKVEWNHVPTRHGAEGVKVTVSDPVFVNPASYKAVTEVLRSIGQAAKITRYGFSGPEARQWLSVTMDGSPYSLAVQVLDKTLICVTCAAHKNIEHVSFFGKEWQQHLKSEHKDCEVVSAKEFDWVVLRIGPLHVEMNMVKTFFALNWDVMICDLAKEMGFTSEAALKYAKSATNHHHAMTMIDILQKGVWSELLVPYVRQRMTEGSPLSVSDFLYRWMETVNDPNYLFMFEQLWRYVGAIKVYHIGVRRNNHDYVNAGLLAFSPMFSVHPFSSKYQLIELYDRCERILYPADLNDFIKRTESVSTSSNQSKGEGLDAQLEEVNKDSKTWAVGAMTATEWLRIFRNHDNLGELRTNVLSWLGVRDPKDEAAISRKRDSLVNEVLAWRVKLRGDRYLSSPHDHKDHVSMSGKLKLDKDLINMTEIALKNREAVFVGAVVNGKARGELDLQDVYVSEEERAKKNAIANQTKPRILKMIREKINFINNELIKESFTERFQSMNRSVDRTIKADIIAFYDEVLEQVNCFSDDTDHDTVE